MTVRLELFDERHLNGMAAVLDDPDVLRFTRVPVPVPEGFARTWFAAYEQGRRDGTRELFAIVDAGDGAFLGLAMAAPIHRETRTAELGYVVAPAARGRGVATGALTALTAWAFDALEALRLELVISVDNEPSKRVAAHCGYVREGVLRSVFFKQDLREDVEIWARLPGDEPAPLIAAAAATGA
jgi:RimJ/RimL family protein N-acetyltransferase